MKKRIILAVNIIMPVMALAAGQQATNSLPNNTLSSQQQTIRQQNAYQAPSLLPSLGQGNNHDMQGFYVGGSLGAGSLDA